MTLTTAPLVGQRHFDALLESQTVVAQSFNAQPEAPAERADAGASGWALNDALDVTYACCHRRALCEGLLTPHTSLTEGLPAPRFAPTFGDLRSVKRRGRETLAEPRLVLCHREELGLAHQPQGASPRFWPHQPWASAQRLILKFNSDKALGTCWARP